MSGRWLAAGFQHPDRTSVDDRYHVRPIGPADAAIDYAAVMSSQDRLWNRYGATNGWPRVGMTLEEDAVDLARHAREAEANESFNYAILDHAEAVLAGCIYLDPPSDSSADVDVSWWVTDALLGSSLDETLQEFVPAWISAEWPFRRPRLDAWSSRG